MDNNQFEAACDRFLLDAGIHVQQGLVQAEDAVSTVLDVICKGDLTTGQVKRSVQRLRQRYRKQDAAGQPYKDILAGVLVGDTTSDFLLACGSRSCLEAALVLHQSLLRVDHDLSLGFETTIPTEIPLFDGTPENLHRSTSVHTNPARTSAVLKEKLPVKEALLVERIRKGRRVCVRDSNSHTFLGLVGKSLCAFQTEKGRQYAVMPPYEVWVEGLTGVPVEVTLQYLHIGGNIAPEVRQALKHEDMSTLDMFAGIPQEEQPRAVATFLMARTKKILS